MAERMPVNLAHLLITALILFPRQSPAEIYSWKDPLGVRHFSNTQIPFSNDAVTVFPENPKTDATELQRLNVFKVIAVYDGDSIKVKTEDLTLMVRLAGIDAPETRHKRIPGQPFSQRSKKKLERLISGKIVTLKSFGIDAYNRQLAEVFSSGINVNLLLVRAGLAEVYPGPFPKGLERKRYREAETDARKRRRGIWSLGSRYVSPGKWRKKHVKFRR